MIPTATTELYGLIGTPIGHSFSPRMHNTAFEETGEDSCYLAFDTDLDELDDVVSGLKALGAKGWNVTMPLKTEMAARCDKLSPEAKLIGAVNTVVNNNGELTGYSTDGIGFFANAKDHGFNPQGKKLLLLGAGGAARSIAAQALFEGIDELAIFNRTVSKAEKLVEELAEEAQKQHVSLSAHDFADKGELKTMIEEADLVINATSVGMNPEDQAVIFDSDWLHPGTVIADIVYTPVKTRLEREAEEHGCQVLDGLGMVLWQGAYSFKYWTGKDFPIDLIKEQVFGIEK